MREKLIKLLGGFTTEEVETVVNQLSYQPPKVLGFRQHLNSNNN